MHEQIFSGDVANTTTLAAYTAHEVRNPLAALRAMAQLTLVSSDTHVRDTMMRQIVEGIDELDQFLRQILCLLRPASAAMQLVDIGTVLRSVAQLFAAQADEVGADVRLLIPSAAPVVWGNPELLRHVFINLVKNALEAMPKGGPLILSVKRYGPRSTVRVSVRDYGDGIPEALREHLLVDTEASSRPAGGGIGLPFVRRVVVDIHGGRVWFRTKMGAGTVFRVELPGVAVPLASDNVGLPSEDDLPALSRSGRAHRADRAV